MIYNDNDNDDDHGGNDNDDDDGNDNDDYDENKNDIWTCSFTNSISCLILKWLYQELLLFTW